ncbi:extracellular catalytic domain type 2 short-chain-length polyhydroxyalkanoate depolymerase [Actinomadura rudentiformis]|uniref:Poly(3-hydroxybutyrate) depolymerase n=1 Tax=Actinomadura rudentiformis TaxID=359158 RepID=A0A6H9YQE4_9ACTN|nr:PHB depolymerase family esterase [Actinomadura rudentiformis]KAB2343084.1 poly(3-hydroxybutyrate) depolymerase [Actinomadura rudentiformis]
MRIRRALLVVLTALGLTASLSIARASVPPPTRGTLTGYDISATYVSGLSSGGFMANQLHVAYSSVFKGAGIFSAGPYDCAQNNLNTALYACMETTLPRKTPAQLQQLTRDRAAAGKLDPVQNLSGAPVWLFHGTADATIKTAVNDDLATYYGGLGANVSYNKTSGAGHAWVSPIGPNDCGSTASPYVNKCGTTDPVKEMLAHLFGTVAPASTSPLTGKLIQFDQAAYVPGGDPGSVSLGSEGFAYVPKACEGASCKLMVTLHGCYQYHGLVGNALMDKGYLNEYADSNNMIVLYPQATTMIGNPRGCWDWWGYQSAAYPLKSGPQMASIIAMVKALGGVEGEGDPTPTPTPTPTPECITASNYAHTTAGRAYVRSGQTYAAGSNQPLGLWNTFTSSTLKQTSPGHWVTC